MTFSLDEVARNQVIDGEMDWYGLPTPSLQQILDAQRLPEEAYRWMYAFIGRMLYSVGELDGLQLIVYLKGVAGTGKALSGPDRFTSESTRQISGTGSWAMGSKNVRHSETGLPFRTHHHQLGDLGGRYL